MSYWGFRPYVPVAARRAEAAKEIEKLNSIGWLPREGRRHVVIAAARSARWVWAETPRRRPDG